MGNRGKVIEVELNRAIVFNEAMYLKARIEIDHVNFGLDPKSKELNKKKRSDFSPKEIGEFILALDGIDLVPGKLDEGFSFFALELISPIKGKDLGKKFRLVFTTAKNDPGVIGTITLYRVR
jgi:hypothetical protein